MNDLLLPKLWAKIAAFASLHCGYAASIWETDVSMCLMQPELKGQCVLNCSKVFFFFFIIISEIVQNFVRFWGHWFTPTNGLWRSTSGWLENTALDSSVPVLWTNEMVPEGDLRLNNLCFHKAVKHQFIRTLISSTPCSSVPWLFLIRILLLVAVL